MNKYKTQHAFEDIDAFSNVFGNKQALLDFLENYCFFNGVAIDIRTINTIEKAYEIFNSVIIKK